MIKDLYTFSRSAWHVKLFKWVYGVDPTQIFHTMCPYFWSLVATVILTFIIPIIPFIKMFGKTGTALLKSLESRKRDKLKRQIEDFQKRCSEEMTDEEAHSLVTSKCWDRFYYEIDNDLYQSIREKYSNHCYYLYNLREEKSRKEAQRRQKVKEVKESKWFTYTAYLVSFLIFSLIGYAFYAFFSSIEFRPVDWKLIGILGAFIAAAIAVVFGAIGLYNYVLKPFAGWLQCIKLPKCRLCQLGLGKYIAAPFIFLGKGILIVLDMIYMTYKKACPRVTWKNEEN